MVFLWLIVGFVLGAGGAYYYFSKNQKPLQNAAIDGTIATNKAKALLQAVESCHYLSFGPIGAAAQAKVDAFNKLWKLAGLKENGAP